MKKISLFFLCLFYCLASLSMLPNQSMQQFVDGNQRCVGENCIPNSTLEVAKVPTENMRQFNDTALECNTIACVNDNITSIDEQLVILIGQRLAFAKRAAQLKNMTQYGIANDTQFNKTLLQAMQQAEAVGYPRNIARVIFTAIIMQSNLFASS